MKTSIWLEALRRRASASSAFATVLHKGDADSGSVIVSVRDGAGRHRLYSPAINMAGARIWLQSAEMSEAEAGVKIAARRARDTDLWVIEIEDREGRHFLTDPVEAAPPR